MIATGLKLAPTTALTATALAGSVLFFALEKRVLRRRVDPLPRRRR
jgi:hypothetical protein